MKINIHKKSKYYVIITKFIILIIFVIILNVSAKSQISIMNDNERIGKSDLIIIGTINEVTDIGKPNGKFTIKETTVLKGKVKEKFNVVNLSSFRENKVKMLEEGSKYIFFLYRVQDGYTLFHGSLGMLPVTDELKIRNLIKDFPVKVVIAEPVKSINLADPFSDFNLSITITNVSKESINISLIELEGCFESKDFPVSDLYKLRDPERNGKHNNLMGKTTIEPNGKYTAELLYPIEKPEDWLMNPPKEKKKYDLFLRVCVNIDANNENKNVSEVYHVCSQYCKTAIEYIPIED